MQTFDGQSPDYMTIGRCAASLLTDVALGTRSKREWELTLVHAALTSGVLPRQVDALGVALRISQRKAQLLLDELDLRFADRDSAALDRALLVEVIEPYVRLRRLAPARDTGRIELQIDRLLLRERFRSLVRAEFGLVERGLDGSLLSVQPEVFLTVVLGLANVSEAELTAHWHAKSAAPGSQGKSVGRLFAEEFAKGAGNEAGSKAVVWTERLLTGGLSDAFAWLRLN